MSKFKYSAIEAATMSFDLIEIEASPVRFVRQFFKFNDGKTKESLSIDEVDVTKKDNKVYMVMEIDHPSYVGKELGQDLHQLNACKGFKESIVVDGDTFDFLEGTMITIAGKTLLFTIKK